VPAGGGNTERPAAGVVGEASATSFTSSGKWVPIGRGPIVGNREPPWISESQCSRTGPDGFGGLRTLVRGEWDTLGRLLGGAFVLGAIFMAVVAPRLGRMMKLPHGGDTGPVVGWILLAVLGILLVVRVELLARLSLLRHSRGRTRPVRLHHRGGGHRLPAAP
jgi:hypothetical protein